MSKHLDVLIIEDSVYDTELLLRQLKKSGYDPEYERVETAGTLSRALKRKKWDVILSDYSMSNFNSSAALKILSKSGADIPFIFVSGTMSEGSAVSAMVAGASDYLVKDNLIRLGPAIERELREAELRRYHRIIEKQYEAILRTTMDGFWIIEIGGRFLDVNEAYCRMIGYSRDELLSMSITDIEASEKVKEIQSHINGIAQKGTDRFESSHRRKDGSIVDVEISANYIKESGGRIFVFIRDITERKAAQEKLRQSVEKLQVAFDYASEAIVITNLNGEIKEVNNRALYLHKYDSTEDLIGLQALNLIASKDRLRAKDNFRKTVKTGRAGYVGFTFMTKDGGEFLGEMSSSLLRDKSGSPTGFFAIIRDVGERKQTEKALNSERSRAKMYLDNAAVLMLAINGEGNVTLINKKGCDILGCSDDDVIGKNWFDNFVPRRIRDSLKNGWYSELMAGNIEPVLYFESPLVTCTGEERIMAWHNVPITGEKDKVIGILSSGEDITSRRETEQALKESEENYHHIFESVAVSIWEEDLADLKDWIDGLKNQGVTDFRQYISQNSDLIYQLLGMIKVTNINQQSLELFEAQSKKELMQSMVKILTPEAFNTLINQIVAIAEERPFFKTEVNLKTLQGKRLDVILTLVFPEPGSSFKRVPLTIVNITDRKLAEIELENSFKKLQNTLEKTVKALASAVEMRDAYTAGHQQRVTLLAVAIAQELSLSQERIDIIRFAGILHDIGKISVPAEILSKPGRLNEAEYNLMKMHPRSGYDIVKTVELPCEVGQIILQHHERLNGSGYPHGISREDMLFESRILAVADVVEAMSSHRPYRPALGIEAALEEINKNKGTLYDEQVVDACTRLFREKNFEFG